MNIESLIVLYVGSFIFGSMVGSFGNVCIHRLPLGESIVFPASHCPKCNADIRWFDNIPIFGWLFLGGKCRSCKQSISIRYPIIETLFGLTSLACFYYYGPSAAYFIYFYALACMIILSAIDLEHYIIPDVIVLPGAIIGLAASFYLCKNVPGAPTPLMSLAGALGGAGFLWGFALLYKALTGREGLGFGDVKLMLMIGAFSGPIGSVEAIFLGSMLGSIIGGIFVAVTKKGRLFRVPFGPFLALGLFHFVFFGHAAFTYYYDVLRPLLFAF